MDGKVYIHLFRTRNGYYIYDVNTNGILRVSKELYYYIDAGMKGDLKNINKELENKIAEISNDGFLSSNHIREVEHPYSELLPYYIKHRINSITLQVTQQCNLRCHYCAYSGLYENRGHSNKRMSFDIAKKCIDFLLQNSAESPKLNIGFYGGEPLLEFDMISECVQYVKDEAEGKEVKFSMTTNGTLLNEKIVKLLVENNFHVLISLDGPEEIHDKNRRFVSNDKGTFKMIMNNVAYMRCEYPEYVEKNISFNAVLDGTTDFNCMNEFFCKYEDIKDFKVNISSIADKYLKSNVDVYENYLIQQKYEKFKYMLYKINKLDRKYATKLFDKEFAKFQERVHQRKLTKRIFEKDHPGGPCIPAIKKLFIDVNGTFYPCERVSELSEQMKIGNIYKGLDLDKMMRILNIGKVSENACKNCWAYRFCYSCAAMADDFTGFSEEKKRNYCKSIRSHIEEDFKNYCALCELDCDFEEPEIKNKEM